MVWTQGRFSGFINVICYPQGFLLLDTFLQNILDWLLPQCVFCPLSFPSSLISHQCLLIGGHLIVGVVFKLKCKASSCCDLKDQPYDCGCCLLYSPKMRIYFYEKTWNRCHLKFDATQSYSLLDQFVIWCFEFSYSGITGSSFHIARTLVFDHMHTNLMTWTPTLAVIA